MDVIDNRTGQTFRLRWSPELTEELDRLNQVICKHPQTELRIRVVRGGGTQRRPQCLVCGDRIGTPLKAQAGEELPPDDEALAIAYQERKKAERKAVYQRHVELQSAERVQLKANYHGYLTSEGWLKKRAKVLKRANGLCEGCGDRPPTQVHHLSYEHIFDELLFELVALCGSCHDRCHDHELSELPCFGCRNQSEVDGVMHCIRFDLPSHMALSGFGPCGPEARALEPLR